MADTFVHPPKPVMALRVGVTGHRQSRLAADQRERIAAQVQHVLDATWSGLKRASEKYDIDYAASPPIRYFVSALADGADTLAAKKALTAGWRLLAPLPFSKEQYRQDFSAADGLEFDALLARAHAVAELDGARCDALSEERAYLQAGIVTVDQSDLVIAIWDGEEARGVAGTAVIKQAALEAGKPVIWINAVKDAPLAILKTDGSASVFTEAFIHEAVDALVAPPALAEIEHPFSGKSTHALCAYRDYARERAHGFNWGSFFQFWEKVFGGEWPFAVRLRAVRPAKQIEAARCSTLARKLEASPRDQDIFNKVIVSRFAWADHLAIHYGNLYRSSYFFNYIFAAVAVFLALLDLVTRDLGFGSKTLWISLEVALIAFILIITFCGRNGRWHEKWIDYRQLAEEIRQYRVYFLTLGRNAGGAEYSRGEGGESATWVDWYFAAMRREAGMTSASFDRAAVHRIAQTVLEEEIRPQIAYHDRKAGILHAMEHRLHHYGEYAFGATLLVCLAYLGLTFMAGKEPGLPLWAYETKNKVVGLVTMMTGFLPAVGAAFFGIRVQGEFGSTAERSHATAAQLKAICEKFEDILSADAPRLDMLRRRVEEAATAMLMENMDWRLLYISKPLNLPG